MRTLRSGDCSENGCKTAKAKKGAQEEVGAVQARNGDAKDNSRNLHVADVVVVEMCRCETLLDVRLQVLVCAVRNVSTEVSSAVSCTCLIPQ